MSAITIDEFCGKPDGTFNAFAKRYNEAERLAGLPNMALLSPEQNALVEWYWSGRGAYEFPIHDDAE